MTNVLLLVFWLSLMKSWQIGDGEMYQFCALFGKVCDTTNLLVLFPFTYFYSLLLFSNKRQRVTYCLVLPLLTFICTLCNFKCFSRGHFNNKVLKYFQILKRRITFIIIVRYFSFFKPEKYYLSEASLKILSWMLGKPSWLATRSRRNNLWC